MSKQTEERTPRAYKLKKSTIAKIDKKAKSEDRSHHYIVVKLIEKTFK